MLDRKAALSVLYPSRRSRGYPSPIKKGVDMSKDSVEGRVDDWHVASKLRKHSAKDCRKSHCRRC